MLGSDALLRLPCGDSLILAGIEYAKLCLRRSFYRPPHLRRLAAEAAVELAFRRWLDERGVPYRLRAAAAFTDSVRPALYLGGRRCQWHIALIGRSRLADALRRDPQRLLAAAALVPETTFQSGALEENDFYLFGFLLAAEMRRRDDWPKIIRAGRPYYLLHVPAHWRPGAASCGRWANTWAAAWRSLGRLIVRNTNCRPIEVEVGGQAVDRAVIAERLQVPPCASVETQAEFFSWLYLHTRELPAGIIEVHSRILGETCRVAPLDWSNLWLYDAEAIVAGWLTKGAFRARSRKLPAGARVLPHGRIVAVGRSLAVGDLRPIHTLAALVENAAWDAAGR